MSDIRLRTKPLEVSARRFDMTDLEGQEQLASWCGGRLRGIRLPSRERVIQIDTAEGEVEVGFGDWVVDGPVGGFLRVTDADLRLIYDVLDEPAAAPGF